MSVKKDTGFCFTLGLLYCSNVTQVSEQTKKTINGFVEVLEKSIGKETSAAMRAEIAQSILEYKNAMSDASLSPAEQKKIRNNLFGTFFELGGNQKGLRGARLRGLLSDLDTVMKSAGRATEILDQMYGTPSVAPSGIDVDDNDPDDNPLGASDSDDKWSLDKDKKFLEERLKLKKDYYAGEIKTEEELQNRILQLEIDTIQERLKLGSLSADERISLEEDLQDRLNKQQEAAAAKNKQIQQEVEVMKKESLQTTQDIRDAAIREEIERYEKKKKEYEGNAEALELLEKQHQRRLAKIQMDYLNGNISDAAATYKTRLQAKKNEHQEELALFKGSARQLKILKERQAEELAAIDLEYATELQDILDSVLYLEGSIDIVMEGLTPAELEEIKQKLEEIRALRNSLDGTTPKPDSDSSSQASSPSKTGTMFGLDSDEWEAMFDSGVDGWKRLELAAKAFGEIAQSTMDIVSKAMERQSIIEEQQLKQYQKDQQTKRSALEKRLEAGLMTEAQYNAEIQKMDDEYAAYEEELALKQAKREKALSLTQAIINTAMGVTMALGSMVPPLNFINAGIVAAMGAAEIALIASTPITTGYAKGGKMKVRRAQDGKIFDARLSPDERGFINGPTALVSEDGTEYVIPADGVSNPSLAPFLNTIETARRQGRLKNLTFESLYAPSMTGRASGGFVDSEASVPATSGHYSGMSPELEAILNRILDKLDNPVPAIVQMLGSKGLIEQLERYYKNKKNGNING